ncbi:MAG: PilN domain-containing protein, partial [Tissierellaceae bacterium]
NLITEDFLTRLTSRLPLDAFLTNLSLSPNEINIIGIAKDRWDVADFSKSLEDLEEADKVFISDIKRESDYYKFNINLQLKDVNTDGE